MWSTTRLKKFFVKSVNQPDVLRNLTRIIYILFYIFVESVNTGSDLTKFVIISKLPPPGLLSQVVSATDLKCFL
jgi:hypothetical protein